MDIALIGNLFPAPFDKKRLAASSNLSDVIRVDNRQTLQRTVEDEAKH